MAIARLLETRDLVEAAGPRADHFRGRIRVLPVHRRYLRDHRDPGWRRHLRLPVLHADVPGQGTFRPLRFRHRRQPSARDRAILDIGQKSISQHQTPPSLAGLSKLPSHRTFRRHATIAVDSQISLPIGEKVQVLPGYGDFTFVLQTVFWVSGGTRRSSLGSAGTRETTVGSVIFRIYDRVLESILREMGQGLAE